MITLVLVLSGLMHDVKQFDSLVARQAWKQQYAKNTENKVFKCIQK